ncbi:MAG: hypothetical protein ACYDA8_16190, partial [Deferrisomatales bacterium]
MARTAAERMADRPAGEVLQALLADGPARFPFYLVPYPEAPEPYRAAVLMGGLALGPEVSQGVQELVGRRDSPEKRAAMRGLAELGHPRAEGYFARVLREGPSVLDRVDALGCLGALGGAGAVRAIAPSLADPFLFEAACEALARCGGAEAEAALLPRAHELPALTALARLGAAGAREAFEGALTRDRPWAVAGVEGLGRLGDPGAAARVRAGIGDGGGELGRAAFAAYARCGAPLGAEPLLAAAEAGVEPWMVEPLSHVDHPEVHRRLLAAVAAPRRPTMRERLRPWRRPPT